MTGTLYGTASFNWVNGFVFGAVLAALASIIVYFKAKAPTVEDMQRAVERAHAGVEAGRGMATS